MAVERETDPEPLHPRRNRELWRWVVPIGGGAISTALIVLATPHVVWGLRLFLAIVCFLLLAGQSAAYLWNSDQGE